MEKVYTIIIIFWINWRKFKLLLSLSFILQFSQIILVQIKTKRNKQNQSQGRLLACTIHIINQQFLDHASIWHFPCSAIYGS